MLVQVFSYEIFHYYSRICIIILGVPSQLSCADFPISWYLFVFFLLYSFVFDKYTSVATLVLINCIESELLRLYMAEDVLILYSYNTLILPENIIFFLDFSRHWKCFQVLPVRSDATLFPYLRKSLDEISYFLLGKYGEFSTIFSVDFNDAPWCGNIFVHCLGL